MATEDKKVCMAVAGEALGLRGNELYINCGDGQPIAVAQLTFTDIPAARQLYCKPLKIRLEIEECDAKEAARIYRLNAASPDYHNLAGETADFLASLADTLDRWANESRSGGWSTHQIDANRDEANNCRRMAAKVRKVIAKAT